MKNQLGFVLEVTMMTTSDRVSYLLDASQPIRVPRSTLLIPRSRSSCFRAGAWQQCKSWVIAGDMFYELIFEKRVGGDFTSCRPMCGEY